MAAHLLPDVRNADRDARKYNRRTCRYQLAELCDATCMGTDYLLQAVELIRIYHPRRRFLQKSARPVTAVNRATLALRPGSTLAITGPSGSGKSTLARCLACLERPDGGDLVFDGQNVTGLPLPILRHVRRQIQMVPQSSA